MRNEETLLVRLGNPHREKVKVQYYNYGTCYRCLSAGPNGHICIFCKGQETPQGREDDLISGPARYIALDYAPFSSWFDLPFDRTRVQMSPDFIMELMETQKEPITTSTEEMSTEEIEDISRRALHTQDIVWRAKCVNREKKKRS